MRVVVTGASGFVGGGLARRLAGDRGALGVSVDELILADRAASDMALPGFARWHCGDLTEPAYLDALLQDPVDMLFHLASMPGAAAEKRADGGEAVNLAAPAGIARRLAAREGTHVPPRIVFASTIAVYGALPADSFSETVLPQPRMSYGAHKLMTEIHLADLSRRGAIDARSVRLPGIVPRPPAETGHGSAFMSQIFHKARTGEPYVCPVRPGAASWWMSRRVCVDNLLHAARLGRNALQPSRVWQLPALHARIDDVVAALERRFGPDAVRYITYAPDPAIETMFAGMPPLNPPGALAAGFLTDWDVDKLVDNAMT